MKVEYTVAQRSSELEQYVAYQQLQQVIAYCDSAMCRRRMLLEYFGETFQEENCGNCDNCADGSAYEEDYDDGAAAAAGGEQFPLQAAVVHKEWGAGIVMRHEEDVIQATIDRVARTDYPRRLVQIIVVCSADDVGTIERADASAYAARAKAVAAAKNAHLGPAAQRNAPATAPPMIWPA